MIQSTVFPLRRDKAKRILSDGPALPDSILLITL
jgi:hypothetical protein